MIKQWVPLTWPHFKFLVLNNLRTRNDVMEYTSAQSEKLPPGVFHHSLNKTNYKQYKSSKGMHGKGRRHSLLCLLNPNRFCMFETLALVHRYTV